MEDFKAEDSGPDVSLPHGCPTCDGALDVRIRKDVAGASCPICHRSWLPKLQLTQRGLLLMHPLAVG
jgi:hypothetical protein